jgi:hypothetical protein
MGNGPASLFQKIAMDYHVDRITELACGVAASTGAAGVSGFHPLVTPA